MTNTVVSSASKDVVIGFEQPFVVIGERINPTGRKLLAEEMKAGDYSRVEADAGSTLDIPARGSAGQGAVAAGAGAVVWVPRALNAWYCCDNMR